jgi:hypothetical protein
MGLRHDGRERREFADDLFWSVGSGAASALEVLNNPVNFPDVVGVVQTNERDDRSGVDFWVQLGNGCRVGVDLKLRRPDWAADELNPKDDLTLETWSVVDKRIPGWTRDPQKKCDYILFFWPDTGRWCMIPFRPLLSVFLEHWRDWRKIYETNVSINSRGSLRWRSEAVFVPRCVVLGLIEERYGGAPPARKVPRNNGNDKAQAR